MLLLAISLANWMRDILQNLSYVVTFYRHFMIDFRIQSSLLGNNLKRKKNTSLGQKVVLLTISPFNSQVKSTEFHSFSSLLNVMMNLSLTHS